MFMYRGVDNLLFGNLCGFSAFPRTLAVLGLFIILVCGFAIVCIFPCHFITSCGALDSITNFFSFRFVRFYGFFYIIIDY
jgi:hypothetical protein